MPRGIGSPANGSAVLAVGAHPDDIEFAMSGTLFLARAAGCRIHYLTVANGSCGTEELPAREIIAIRRRESKAAADLLGATFHESFCNDIEIFYSDELLRRVTAVVRRARPRIMLVPSLEDYMEDHMIAARLAVTAAFCRGMRNYTSMPAEPLFAGDVTVYHAEPHTLSDGMGRPVTPTLVVDVESVMEEKRRMLACHESQKSWLDSSQGMDSYLCFMEEMAGKVGRMSGTFRLAEGWRRHSHVGFSQDEGDPLRVLLGNRCTPVETAP